MGKNIKRVFSKVAFDLGLTQTDGVRVRLLLPYERKPLLDAITSYIANKRRLLMMNKRLRRNREVEYVRFH